MCACGSISDPFFKQERWPILRPAQVPWNPLDSAEISRFEQIIGQLEARFVGHLAALFRFDFANKFPGNQLTHKTGR